MSSVTLLHLLSHSQHVESQLPETDAIPSSSQAHNPERSARMEFVGSGGSGLLVVPGPNYLEADSDNEDEEVVIGIRPKSSPQPRRKTSVSEDESDISEPPSLSGSRRVSFADTVGLSLVQVKEFDKWDIPQLPDYLDSTNNAEDEYFISPFNFPLSLPVEEIIAKVLDQKVELESIELLPGTTILKGVIRVLNISFTKAVYVRTSLDNWVSHFDLLCEYIPGSGDGHSDSFSFKLTLMPPFAELGARVDFCLRYETPSGTFWANNRNRNYVLFCYKRKKEVQDKPQKEHLNKKSCLKTVSQSSSLDESMSFPERENHAADATMQPKITTESQSSPSDNSPVKSEEEANTLQVENRRNRSRRNRRKAARMARVREHFAQKALTTQNDETQESPENHLSAAHDQHQSSEQSNPKESVQFEEGTANGSLSKDSSSMKHERFNLAEAVTNDSRDESKDVPKVATALHQNPNNLICTIEETSAETTTNCSHPSGEGDHSKRPVCDPSGFAFGTVVAPLYQEVSGSQLYSEMKTTMKEQQETEERNSSNDRTEINVYKERCCGDGKAESTKQVVEATSSNDEMLQTDNDTEKSSTIQDSLKVQINTIPDVLFPIYGLNCNLLKASEKVLDCKSEISNSDMTLDLQKHVTNEAVDAQLLENDISNSYLDMNREDTVLKTGAHEPSPLESEKQLYQNSDKSDTIDPSIENSDTNSALQVKPSNEFVLCHKENEFKKECLQNEIAETSDGVRIGREFVDNSLAIPLQDFSGKSEEILSFELSQHEELLDHSANIRTCDPNLVPETCGIVSPSNLSKVSQENLHLKPQLSQTVLDPSTNLCNSKDEISLEFEDQTRALSPKQVSETPADAEQLLTKNVPDQPPNMSNLIRVPDNETSVLRENTQLASQLSQNVDSKGIVFEDQSAAVSPTQTFVTPAKENEFLLLEQNKGLVDEPNNTGDLTGEVSLEDEDTQTPSSTYETSLSVDENTTDVTEVMTQDNQIEIFEKGNVLLEQNEDLENKSNPKHNNSTTITERQELDENFEIESSLLGENSCVQDLLSNCSNLMDEVCDHDAECVMVTSTCLPKSFEENLNLSLQPSEIDKPVHPGPGELKLSENLFAISPNLAISDGESKCLPMQLSQNECLPNFNNDPINNNALSKTVALLTSPESHEENPSSPVDDFKCSLISLVDQPTNAGDLLGQPELMPDLTKTVAVSEKEDEKNLNLNTELEGHEIISNSEISFEDKLEMTTNYVETEQKETSKHHDEELSEAVEMDRQWMVESAVENSGDNSKTPDNCDKDETSENVAHFEMLKSHIETIDATLGEENKTWEVMVEEEQKDIENIITSLVEDDKLELVEIVSAGHIGDQYATEEIQKREDVLDEFETTQDPQVNNNETYFEPVEGDKLESLDSKLDSADVLESAGATEDIWTKGNTLDDLENVIKSNVEMESLCSSSEENIGECASVNEKLLNECTESKIMDSMDSSRESENTNVDYTREVKIQSKSNEEERFKIPPRKVRSKLSAPVNNVQEGIQSSQVEIVEETPYMPNEIGKTDSLCCSKDASNDTFAEDFKKYDQDSDTESPSESESDSEDEMELYMHCLRAVYGQQSSSKATKLELNRDKEFKRAPSTRSKRLSTSLPSISESLDEEQLINLTEQPINMQEKDIETVEVQCAGLVLLDSSPKEENDDDLWWKINFSCRNILKSLLYAILVVLFLAVSYHYDFIACFGLYVISVIWLFFQGDKQTGKKNS